LKNRTMEENRFSLNRDVSQIFASNGSVVYDSEMKFFEKGDFKALLYRIYDYFDKKTFGDYVTSFATFLVGIGIDGIYSYMNDNKQLSLLELVKGIRAEWIYITLLILGIIIAVLVLIVRALRLEKSKEKYFNIFMKEGKSGQNPTFIQLGALSSNVGSRPFNTGPQMSSTSSGNHEGRFEEDTNKGK